MHFSMSISQIELLNGSNFKKWKSDIELNLGVLDYDHVLKEDPPEALPAIASKESKEKYEKWYKHNKMALIMIKKSITENVIGGIPDSEFAKVFFNSIAEKYKVSNKAETGKLMKSLMRLQFNGKGSVREYILKGSDIAGKLRGLNMAVEDPFLVYLLLESLPDEYDQLKTLYKTQKEMWSVNELISFCVEVEDEIKKKGKEVSVNLISHSKFKNKRFGNNNYKGSTSTGTSTSVVRSDNIKFKNKPAGGLKCFFCKKPGHFKKDCEGFKVWLTKRGIIKDNNPK
ncbi:putative RNA-directed DNA polymerase [Rosa chinensis]|uniref:Putative RNA-directed DNA polymerase n=1 Tax=Rosa chinensis TaxID=74649 RepID=A0A2P6PLW1_ROSCH|nr:putative RNA-directed DNA polymerase [Rosa chinensis]